MLAHELVAPAAPESVSPGGRRLGPHRRIELGDAAAPVGELDLGGGCRDLPVRDLAQQGKRYSSFQRGLSIIGGMKPSMLGTYPVQTLHPTLLIADDDPVVRSMLSLSLDHQFDIVGVVEDSDQAIALAQECRPDVALVDVQMPGGGGLSAIRGIAGVSPDTAAVVISADEFDPLVRQLMIAGAMTYVRKGIAAADLAEVLHRAMRARPLTLSAAA
jgi:CheY-like chemotaxis protein